MTDVVACPNCGLLVAQTCYHEGLDVRSEVMSAETAAEFRREAVEALLMHIASLDSQGYGERPSPLDEFIMEYTADKGRRTALAALVKEREEDIRWPA